MACEALTGRYICARSPTARRGEAGTARHVGSSTIWPTQPARYPEARQRDSPRAQGSNSVAGDPAIDFAAIFTALPTAYLVMSPDLVIVAANPAYLELLGRTSEDLLGRYVFDAFPPAPETLDADGVNPLQTSFERARDSGEPDHMPLFRYEVLDTATGRPVPRAWSLISAPVLDEQGRTQLVLQRVEDVSEYLAEPERLAEGRGESSWKLTCSPAPRSSGRFLTPGRRRPAGWRP